MPIRYHNDDQHVTPERIEREFREDAQAMGHGEPAPDIRSNTAPLPEMQAAHPDTLVDGRMVTLPLRPIVPPPLPVAVTSFIGREREVAAVVELLERRQTRSVTLTGTGGIGKTRLALEVAQSVAAQGRRPVAFVPLAALRDPSRLLATVAAATGIPNMLPDPSLPQFIGALGSRKLLLVLDNLEQLLDAAPVLADLLAACPGLMLLCASRRRLRIAGEHVFPVEGLPLPVGDDSEYARFLESPAVKLFVERASAIAPQREWTPEQLMASAGICRLVEGEPLAIELAASRVPMLPPTELLRRMEYVLPLLGTGPADAEPRLRTMSLAIQWSYDLLAPDAQRVLRQLSVFIGGCTLDQAVAVLALPAHELLRVLEELIDLSLVRSVVDGDGQHLLVISPPVWEFARDLMEQDDDDASVRNRHAAFFLDWVQMEDFYNSGPSRERFSRADSPVWPNVRASFDWLIETAQGALALELVDAVIDLGWFRLYAAEIRAWMERALRLTAGAAISTARTRITAWAGLMAMTRAEDVAAMRYANQAIDMATELGDAAVHSWVLRVGGQIARGAGEPELALRWLQESIALLGPANQRAAIAAHYELGATLVALERYEEAATPIGVAFELADAMQIPFLIALCDLGFSRLAVQAARIDDARGHLDHVLNGILDQNDLSVVAETLLRAAAFGLAIDRPVEAATLLGAAEAQLERTARLRFRDMAQAAALDRAFKASPNRNALALGRGNGMRLTRDDAIAAARALIQTEPEPSAPDLLAALSARERDVLALLTGGMTDREIAATLFISRSTVSRHVESILRKLAVPSRTAAAVVATRVAKPASQE